MLINLSKQDSNIRVILGAVIIAVGSHYMWMLIPMGIMLMQTGLTSKCPITHLFHKPTKAAQKNLFVNSLPKYNPQPVFIFNSNNQLIFSNKVSQKLFPDLKSFSDLLEADIKSIIENERVQQFTFTSIEETVYSFVARGSIELNSIMVYGTDISEVIDLHKELQDTQKEIIYTMGEIGETRSKETGDHVRRVAEYSQLLALLAGMDKKEAELIKLASPMHDIGKVGIQYSILKKPGKLTEDEFEVMKTHAEIGFNLLNHSNRPVLKTAAIISYQHHEKWNGTGYPQQLEGDAIHIYGRITAIADVFDALGSARVYKEAWPLEKILELFKAQRGLHFDPILVDLLIEHLDKFLEIRQKYPN